MTVCGRAFSSEELVRIREDIERASPPLRAEIARRVCRTLNWIDALGRPKLMSCRVALLRLHRAGLIELPPPRNGNGNGNGWLLQRVAWPQETPLNSTLGELGAVTLEPVADKADSALWNGLIERYHYLGYSPLPGVQMRYLIRSADTVLGAIGFGAAAWKVAARDTWIGWDARTREQHLSLVLNNARFLILPWVRVPHLASKVLSLASRRIGDDIHTRYGIRPVLLETFVETARYRGTCYRAANWVYLGETAGRGKCDRTKSARLPVKAVYAYPLHQDFRRRLASAGPL
jgi:hypothetical protein